jgi:hypothetical protein
MSIIQALRSVHKKNHCLNLILQSHPHSVTLPSGEKRAADLELFGKVSLEHVSELHDLTDLPARRAVA